VDISSGGARLRGRESLPELTADSLSLSVQGAKDNGRLQGLKAYVRWRAGQEVGVQFAEKRDMPLSSLQRLVG
jgi:hypothetical protein